MFTDDIRRVDINGKSNTECITFVTICQKLKFENINFFWFDYCDIAQQISTAQLKLNKNG